MQDFRVIHNVKDLLQQAVEVLRRELVENALHLPRRLQPPTPFKCVPDPPYSFCMKGGWISNDS